jgi:hypothetical protein
MQPNLAPTAHHPLAPSSWPAWEECPRYDAENDDLDDAEASIIAVENGEVDDPDDDSEEVQDKTPKGRGRLQHAALAAILKRESEEVIKSAVAPLSLREEGEVRWVAERIIELVEMHGWSVAELKVEQRVTHVDEKTFRVTYFGTRDAVCGPLLFEAKFGFMRS